LIFLYLKKTDSQNYDVKANSFETLRNVFRSEKRRTHLVIRGFKTNYFSVRFAFVIIFLFRRYAKYFNHIDYELVDLKLPR